MIPFHHRFLNTHSKDKKKHTEKEKGFIAWAEELTSSPDTKHFDILQRTPEIPWHMNIIWIWGRFLERSSKLLHPLGRPVSPQ